MPNETVSLGSDEVTYDDLRHVIDRVGSFGEDNRAGVSARCTGYRRYATGAATWWAYAEVRARGIRTIRIIEDLIFSGKSVLLLGKPGVGKTTMLREVAGAG